MTRIFWLFILFHVSYEQGCDFENQCTSLQIDNFWGLTSGEVPFGPNAPTQDHTYQNSSGHYYFFNLNSGPSYTDSIIKFNDFFNFTDEQNTKCLKFYYIFNSNIPLNLTVKLIMGDLSEVKSTWLTINSFTNSTKNWTLAELTLPQDAYWIQIDLGLSNSKPSQVLLTLDDIFISTECSVKSPQPKSKVLYWCDFESNNCDFENTMRLEWTRLKALDSQDQSPKKDHTTNTENGHYLSSSKLTDSKSAYIERVISPKIIIPDDGIPYCLSFYYNTPLNPGTYATIYITAMHLNSTDSENQLNNEIWSNYKQNKYNEWLWGITNLLPGEIKLGFLVTNNENREISAAIDDIKIHSCSSVNYPKVYGNYYYFEYNCDFDKDLCGFSKSYINLNNEYPSNWTRIKPENNINPSLGPSVDHTTQSDTGYYLAVNLSLPLTANFEASTQSKPIFTHREMCIEFYYYANTEMFSLNSKSFFGVSIGGCYATTLNVNYAFQNFSEPQWTRVVIQLNSYACSEFLNFYFKGADIIRKSFAIDDFRVDRCDRINPITTTTTTVTTSTTTVKTLVTTTQNTTIPISQTTVETITTSKDSTSKYITQTTQKISTKTTSLQLNFTQNDNNNSKLVKSDLFLPFLVIFSIYFFNN